MPTKAEKQAREQAESRRRAAHFGQLALFVMTLGVERRKRREAAERAAAEKAERKAREETERRRREEPQLSPLARAVLAGVGHDPAEESGHPWVGGMSCR